MKKKKFFSCTKKLKKIWSARWKQTIFGGQRSNWERFYYVLLLFLLSKLVAIPRKKLKSPWRHDDKQICTHQKNQFKLDIAFRKQPFLLAFRRWGRFARNNFCDSATEIVYWWRKIVYQWQAKDKRPGRSNVNAMNL